MVNWLETASKLASAEAAALFFSIAGTPVLRDGTVFQLPGIVIEVAQECSGIRSSWVLFITSVLASHLFLKSPWRRVILVVFVIPLGIVRNGFRILVIGLLCVHIGPQMIHSIIHKQGGPTFLCAFADPAVSVALVAEKRRGGGRKRGGRKVDKPESYVNAETFCAPCASSFESRFRARDTKESAKTEVGDQVGAQRRLTSGFSSSAFQRFASNLSVVVYSPELQISYDSQQHSLRACYDRSHVVERKGHVGVLYILTATLQLRS